MKLSFRPIDKLYLVATVLFSAVVVGVAVANNSTVEPVLADQVSLSTGELSKLDCISETHTAMFEELKSDKSNNYKTRMEGYEIPDLQLVDQMGNDVDMTELLASDEPVIMNFIYTSCTTICPVLTSGFTKIQSADSDEVKQVKMISVTIDPEYDTPDVLHRYSQRFHAEDDWLFLTGSLDDIVSLQNAFDAYRGDKMSHIPLTFLRTSADSEWLRIEGFPSVEEISVEYDKLKKI